MRFLILFLLWPLTAFGQTHDARIDAVITQHILPRFEHLVASSANLAEVSRTHCMAEDAELNAAYHRGFDAWIAVSHLRFGPTETDDRAFEMGYWPDTKGFTPKSIRALITDQDQIIFDEIAFDQVSIAARGFHALDYLLFDTDIAQFGEANYRCDLVIAISNDLARNSTAMFDDWINLRAGLLQNAGENDTYQSELEAVQELYKALLTGLQLTSDTRLGRPLGTFDRPRPRRAEAWRSGRSLRHIALALTSLQTLADLLAYDDPDLMRRLDILFASALEAANIDDPVFASVGDVQGRLKVEIIQQRIDIIRAAMNEQLGPYLGVSEGFNALDGD